MQKNIIYHADACMKGRQSCNQERTLLCLLFVCVWSNFYTHTYTHTYCTFWTKHMIFLFHLAWSTLLILLANCSVCVFTYWIWTTEQLFEENMCTQSHRALVVGNCMFILHPSLCVCMYKGVSCDEILCVSCQILDLNSWALVVSARPVVNLVWMCVHIQRYVWDLVLSENSEGLHLWWQLLQMLSG